MRAFLFDLDDTLFDHGYSTRVALGAIRQVLPTLGAVSPAELEARHALVLEEVHLQVLAGTLDVDAARMARFRRLVEMHGGDPRREDVEEGARAYRAAYLEARRAIAGAVPLLQALRSRGAIAIVSNNVRAEQADKIAVCGIAEHVDALVVSEEAGIAKPDPRIFRIALDRLGVSAANALVIGDSWSADILGAHAAGIRAVWFNPLRRPCPDSSKVAAELDRWEPTEEVVGKIVSIADLRS